MQSLYHVHLKKESSFLFTNYIRTQYDFASHVIFPKAEYENTAEF